MRSLFFITLALSGLCLAEGLTPEQTAFIETLKKHDHTYALLKSPTGRVTLVLGEKHIKPHEEAERERQVEDHFHYFATEGTFPENYGMTEWILKEGKRKLRSASDGEAEKELAGSLIHHLEANAPIQQIMPLEINHKPDTYEHLFFWGRKGMDTLQWVALPALLVGMGCQAKMDILAEKEKKTMLEPTPRPRLKKARTALFAIGATTGVGWFVSFFALALHEIMDSHEESTVGLTGNRNVTMAKETAKWDLELNDKKSMVVVVGALHMPGLKWLFEKEHDYEVIEFNDGKYLREYLGN